MIVEGESILDECMKQGFNKRFVVCFGQQDDSISKCVNYFLSLYCVSWRQVARREYYKYPPSSVLCIPSQANQDNPTTSTQKKAIKFKPSASISKKPKLRSFYFSIEPYVFLHNHDTTTQ